MNIYVPDSINQTERESNGEGRFQWPNVPTLSLYKWRFYTASSSVLPDTVWVIAALDNVQSQRFYPGWGALRFCTTHCSYGDVENRWVQRSLQGPGFISIPVLPQAFPLPNPLSTYIRQGSAQCILKITTSATIGLDSCIPSLFPPAVFLHDVSVKGREWLKKKKNQKWKECKEDLTFEVRKHWSLHFRYMYDDCI